MFNNFPVLSVKEKLSWIRGLRGEKAETSEWSWLEELIFRRLKPHRARGGEGSEHSSASGARTGGRGKVGKGQGAQERVPRPV